MGGLLFPEAYLTATRQFVAQNHQWSLEELEASVKIHRGEELDQDCFLLTGIAIEGAKWNEATQNLELNTELSENVPPIVLRWVKVERDKRNNVNADELLVPVYLNKTRKNLIFSVKIRSGDLDKNLLYQRGVALICWQS
jgi:dynein heavy chain 1